MKEIPRSNKFELINKFTKTNFLKIKSNLFSTTNAVQRTLDLEKDDKINDVFKHKTFVKK